MSPQGDHGRLRAPTPSRVGVGDGQRGTDSPSRDGDRSELSGAAGRLFVGRERELSELTAGLEESVLGRGNLFLLSGEPGIGAGFAGFSANPVMRSCSSMAIAST